MTDNPALRETTHRWLGLDVEHDTCCECGWSCQNGDGNPHACARDHAAHVAALRETTPDTDVLRKLLNRLDSRLGECPCEEGFCSQCGIFADCITVLDAMQEGLAALERDKEHALRDELAELIRLVGWMPTIWHEGNTYLKSYDVHKMLIERFEALAGPAAQEEPK